LLRLDRLDKVQSVCCWSCNSFTLILRYFATGIVPKTQYTTCHV
jgi:hypothetical protein